MAILSIKRPLLILGTYHKLQCGCPPYGETEIEAFREFIRMAHKHHGIRYIAEEMSVHGLRLYNREATVTKNLETELQIPVDYVDIDEDTRLVLKISRLDLQRAAILPGDVRPDEVLSKAYDKHLSDPAREGVWLAHVVVKDLWPALLIVGADHVESIERKAGKIGLSTEVLHDCYPA